MTENKNKLMPVIKLKNFPSREKVIKDFELFLTERKSNEKYKLLDNNKSKNKIFLYVPDSITAYKFTEQYNEKILTNPHYANSQCSLTFRKPLKSCLSVVNMKKSDISYMPKYILKTKSRTAKCVNNYNKSVTSISDYTRKHWANIREKAGTVYNDSPYMDIQSKEHIEKLENKKKWIVQKNFDVFVGKASSIHNSHKYEIKNYVNRTPSLPPILHQFRPTHKEKWIGKRNFLVY